MRNTPNPEALTLVDTVDMFFVRENRATALRRRICLIQFSGVGGRPCGCAASSGAPKDRIEWLDFPQYHARRAAS